MYFIVQKFLLIKMFFFVINCKYLSISLSPSLSSTLSLSLYISHSLYISFTLSISLSFSFTLSYFQSFFFISLSQVFPNFSLSLSFFLILCLSLSLINQGSYLENMSYDSMILLYDLDKYFRLFTFFALITSLLITLRVIFSINSQNQRK